MPGFPSRSSVTRSKTLRAWPTMITYARNWGQNWLKKIRVKIFVIRLEGIGPEINPKMDGLMVNYPQVTIVFLPDLMLECEEHRMRSRSRGASRWPKATGHGQRE